MKYKSSKLFVVLFFFICFSALAYKANGLDSCTPTGCTACHNNQVTLCGGGGEYLRQIDWNTEKHGMNSADVAVVLNIYSNTPSDLLPRLIFGGTLLCTDCHEPHGTFTPNAFQLKTNINNIPVDIPIPQLNAGVCNLPSGVTHDKAMGWFCKTCHKDDATVMNNPDYKNQWKYAHHLSGGGSDFPYNRTRCYKCHVSASAEPINCECCHYHGSMTTDYGTSYPCYLDSYICRTPYDRRTF